ncbi:hypothetical protein ONA02_06490 [Mycoplasmopsis felis]|nr:hypothetical protein [Mycoplasmopsis felis]WAM02202.1 hypothetical protein ONA02_06490 [Mycoplasmopsis felis]
MVGLILYLYTKGYRKFLFFVNQINVLEKQLITLLITYQINIYLIMILNI